MKRPNILLVVLDATRADACSCYGAKRLTTPNLDKLAAEGVLFEQAISASPWTLPAMASLFTGLYPGQIDVHDKCRLASLHPTLAQLLSQSGYATFGLTSNSWLSNDFGLQRGFGTMHKQWQWLQAPNDINKLVLSKGSHDYSWAGRLASKLTQGNWLKNALNIAYTCLLAYRRDRGASRVLGPLARWIEYQQKPWFAFVHYLEAHLPYKPPHEWTVRFVHNLERANELIRVNQLHLSWRHNAGVELLSTADLAAWQDLYLAEVAYQDHYLGLLVDWLQHTGQLDNTLVVVVADHGENLGEHGLLNHQYCVYDTLLRVPLVIRSPFLFSAGQRISYQVQTLDLFATILEIAGIDMPPSASKSLFSEREQRRFTVAEYGVPRLPGAATLARFGLRREDLARFERGYTTLRTDTHKLILGTDGSVELYAWPDDPGEESNIADQYPKLVEALYHQLENWWAEHEINGLIGKPADNLEVDPIVEARLRALGYFE